MAVTKGNTDIGRDFLFFIFGIAVSVPLVVYGLSYFADNVETITLVVLFSLLTFSLLAAFFSFFSKKILIRIFGTASTELETLGDPIRDLLDGLLSADKKKTLESGTSILRIILARISWFEVRRWMLGIVIGLTAAFAGLAGSALLFQQNKLLTQQNVKIDDQISLLSIQNDLLKEQTDLTNQISDQSAIEAKQMYTFDFLTQINDEVTAEAIRAVIGLRQLRDLYKATDYNFFEGGRSANIQLMYMLRNWFYSTYHSPIEVYLERIENCIVSEVCQSDITLLFICPIIEHMTIPNKEWLTWDVKKEPYADPLFRMHNSKAVTVIRNRCPSKKKRDITFTKSFDLFRSSASYGEAKRLLANFEKQTNSTLPNNKAEFRDNQRLQDYTSNATETPISEHGKAPSVSTTIFDTIESKSKHSRIKTNDNKMIRRLTIYFAEDPYKPEAIHMLIGQDSREKLLKFANHFNQEFAVQQSCRISIEGHSDDRGSSEFNLGQSFAAANYILEFLLESGISSEQVNVIPYGEENPVVFENTQKAWDLNRRVEVSMFCDGKN